MKFNKRGGIFETYLGWIIVAVIVVALVVGGYLILSGKMQNAGEVIKRFLRG